METNRLTELDHIPPIVDQHAEMAAFLWLLRDDATRAPHYTLWDLARLDERVEAHVDGLRVANEAGWEAVVQGLVRQEPAEVFAASVLAFSSSDPARVQSIADAMVSAPGTAGGAISGLGWLPPPEATQQAELLLRSNQALLRYVAVRAMGVHRSGAEHLRRCLLDESARVRAACLRSLAEIGGVPPQPFLEGLESEESVVVPWAAWGLALRSGPHSRALEVLRDSANDDPSLPRDAIELVARRLAPSDQHAWLAQLQGRPDFTVQAIRVSGAIGRSDAIPWLLDLCTVDDVARQAGEAISMITGVDIAYLDLDRDEPEDAAIGPNDNPDDDGVALDLDEDLPWPDADKLKDWWTEARTGFQRDQRYLAGLPIEVSALHEALRTGYQRQRTAAAIELAILESSRPMYEVRAPGFRQTKELGVAAPPR